jgi:flagellar protein FliS
MTSPAMRSRYLTDSVSTASPARLLVMLFDKLLLDLVQAEAALTAGNREPAAGRLMHAQDIIIELRSSLKIEAWDGATQLAQIYAFVLTELVSANVNADVTRVASCRALVEPLAEAFREAATTAAAPEPAGRVG